MAMTETIATARANGLDLPDMLKEAGLAAVIAFALFATLVGLQITEVQGGQDIETRFVDVIAAVILVFIGRIGMYLVRKGFPLPVLIGGGVVAAIGLLAPLPSSILQILCIGGAIVLSLMAARRMSVPATVLVVVGFGAVFLGLALNILSVASGVLEILVLWYGALAILIGLMTHPKATDGRRHFAGVPGRVVGLLALGAVVLAAVLVVLLNTETLTQIETTRRAVVTVETVADGTPDAFAVENASGETVFVLPAPEDTPRSDETAVVVATDGEGRRVLVEAGLPITTELVSLLVVFYACIAVAVLLANRYAHLMPAREPGAPPFMDTVARRVQQSSNVITPMAMGFALALPIIFYDRQTIDLATLVLTYVMLGWGLNIIVGLAGLLDLGYVAFYAVGAYSYALFATEFGLSFWVCLPIAGVLAAFAGLVLGFPVLRLRGDYFAIVTLGFGEIIRIIILNWYDLTRGPDGIGGIPRPSFFGIAEFTRTPEDGELAFHELFGLEFDTLHRVIFMYYLILALALVVNFFSMRVRRMPIGRAWEALREDDIACQSLGINRRNIKLMAFTFSAMFGGFAGSFFATRQGFISPESFTFIESAIILAIVVLGGMGSQAGVVLAAILLIGLPEVFRELEQYRMLCFGMAMVAVMVWRPRGLLAHREPSVRLYRDRAGGEAQETAR